MIKPSPESFSLLLDNINLFSGEIDNNITLASLSIKDITLHNSKISNFNSNFEVSGDLANLKNV